jgi:hypothetical protein
MKNWKNTILCIITLGVAAFAIYCALLFNKKDAFIFGDSVTYYTKEELTALYWQNEDALNSVKDSVCSEKVLKRMPTKLNSSDFDIYTPEIRVLFSDAEWEDIVYVFQKLHARTLTLEVEWQPLFFAYRMNFGVLKQESGSKTTSLYWFPDEEDRDRFKTEKQKNNAVFTQLDGNWYIFEAQYPW